ncbi:MAG TPA: bifunctional oligoribonuclease/PAP phosphatase NrnA [Ferruginibacter sp.]|nr:bifunctional oligoribonuclease/PAP phosphatase NrnA [Ferruginibacter sp.]HRE62828.1 bifunctional oligoribonuclease/PAP phosphatase NrnA [Ferruginibacter sp.]
MQAIEGIYSSLTHPKKVVITMHQKPDGDAMGSSLGLYHFLMQLGHTVQVISPTNWASFLNWMPACNLVIDFEKNKEKCERLINEAEWIFCLDFNTLSRTKNMEAVLSAAKAERILIDHHQQPQAEMFAYGISDVSKSSTAEMVYDFIIGSSHGNLINTQVSECIYAGVMTDTGSFRFPSTTANVHKLVTFLKEKGLNHSKVHEAIYDNSTENRLRFIGNVLLNRLQIFYEYNTALIAIPQSDLIKYDIKTGDTEGLVNYPLSIEGIKFAAIIIDRGEERKSSFRSKGEFDVNSFARKYFNGGGHFNAAGGSSTLTLEQNVEHFIEAMKENKEALATYQF